MTFGVGAGLAGRAGAVPPGPRRPGPRGCAVVPAGGVGRAGGAHRTARGHRHEGGQADDRGKARARRRRARGNGRVSDRSSATSTNTTRASECASRFGVQWTERRRRPRAGHRQRARGVSSTAQSGARLDVACRRFSPSRSRRRDRRRPAGPGAGAQPPDPQRRFLEIADFRFEGGGRAADGARRLRHLRHAERRARQRGAADHVVRRRLSRLRLRRRSGQGLRSGALLHRDHRDVRQRLVVVAEQHAGRRTPVPTSRRSPSATTSRRRAGCSNTWASPTCAPSPASRWAPSSRSNGRCRTPASWTRSSRGAAPRRPIPTASSGSRARFAR